jgi:hypothetical protein
MALDKETRAYDSLLTKPKKQPGKLTYVMCKTVFFNIIFENMFNLNQI